MKTVYTKSDGPNYSTVVYKNQDTGKFEGSGTVGDEEFFVGPYEHAYDCHVELEKLISLIIK